MNKYYFKNIFFNNLKIPEFKNNFNVSIYYRLNPCTCILNSDFNQYGMFKKLLIILFNYNKNVIFVSNINLNYLPISNKLQSKFKNFKKLYKIFKFFNVGAIIYLDFNEVTYTVYNISQGDVFSIGKKSPKFNFDFNFNGLGIKLLHDYYLYIITINIYLNNRI